MIYIIQFFLIVMLLFIKTSDKFHSIEIKQSEIDLCKLTNKNIFILIFFISAYLLTFGLGVVELYIKKPEFFHSLKNILSIFWDFIFFTSIIAVLCCAINYLSNILDKITLVFFSIFKIKKNTFNLLCFSFPIIILIFAIIYSLHNITLGNPIDKYTWIVVNTVMTLSFLQIIVEFEIYHPIFYCFLPYYLFIIDSFSSKPYLKSYFLHYFPLVFIGCLVVYFFGFNCRFLPLSDYHAKS